MRTLVLLGAAIGVLAAPAAKAAEFTFYDIPTGIATVATGVNDSGQVVGYYQQPGSPPPAYTGFTSTIATPGIYNSVNAAGYTSTQLFGINNSGVAVATLSTPGFGSVAATYNGSFSGAIFPPESVGVTTNAFGQGINTAGTVVGYYVDAGSGTTFGYTYAGSTYTNPIAKLGQPTFLMGMNGAGTAAGYYSDGGGNTHGVTYNGSFSADIDAPGATGGTFATGLSDGGELVGYFIDGSGVHGFVYVDGVFTTIDVPGALGITQILGINNRHQVAGYYVNDEGKQVGFVAYVPEPTTMALLASGAFFLPFARRARGRRQPA